MPARERVLGAVQIVLLYLVSQKGTVTTGESLRAAIVPLYGERVSQPQVYKALRRLKERGLVSAREVRGVHTRGVPQKHYAITKRGEEALREYQRIMCFIIDKPTE